MAKVVVVKKAPKSLKERESVITMPDFLEQVKECSKMLGKGNLTSVNNLRVVVNAVGIKYDPTFSSLNSVNLSKFQGREYNTLEDFAEIVSEVFNRQYPQMVDRYIEYQLRQRNPQVDTIYFVGPEEKVQVFQNFGFVLGKNQTKDDKEETNTQE